MKQNSWEQLCIMNQVIYKKWETDNGQDERLLIVIPRELRPFVLQQLHVWGSGLLWDTCICYT